MKTLRYEITVVNSEGKQSRYYTNKIARKDEVAAFYLKRGCTIVSIMDTQQVTR